MRKLIVGALMFALFAPLGIAYSPQERGDHRDKNDRGRAKQDNRGADARHDDHGAVAVRDDHRTIAVRHDYSRERIVPGHAYPHGRYEQVRHSFAAVSFDVRTRRVVLADHSGWVVAPYDVARCRDWRWGDDTVFVYDDDTHPGWYLLFNARLGRYAHVEFLGGR